MSDHEFWFGDLDLVTGLPPVDGAGYTFHLLAPGTEFGSPDVVLSTVATLMTDGELVEHDRDGNRVHTLTVLVKGPTAVDLAMGEAALAARTKRPTTIRWAPPQSWGSVTTVWPVVTSHMVLEFDDLSELRGERVYRLVVTCEPHARSASLTTVGPLPASDTPAFVEFDDGTSTTGWTGTKDGAPATVTTSGGMVQIEPNFLGSWACRLTRAGSVDFTSTPYLVVDVTTFRSPVFVTVFADGVPLEQVGRRSSADERVVLTFRAPATTVTSLEVRSEASPGLGVYSLARSNTPPGQTRESQRLIPIGGTERTSGSLHVANRVDASLGTVFVHTAPQVDAYPDYAPGLRAWRHSGNTVTADAARLSGAREPIHPDAVVARVPNTVLPPDPYFLAAYLHCATAEAGVRLWWSVRTLNADADPVHPLRATSVLHDFAGGWELVQLGIVTLPVALANGGTTEVHIQRDASETATINVDEAFVFRADEDCGLTLLGAAERHVWLDGPDAEAGTRMSTTWTGTEADLADAHHPGEGLIAAGSHPLRPGVMQVYVASTGAEWPDTEIAYYKAWHTHAPE